MKTTALLFALALGIIGCGGVPGTSTNDNGSTNVVTPGCDPNPFQCATSSDCGPGSECCVSYSANFGGHATTQCVDAGTCQISMGVDTGTSIACASDADCGHSADGGTYSCSKAVDIGFTGNICVAND